MSDFFCFFFYFSNNSIFFLLQAQFEQNYYFISNILYQNKTFLVTLKEKKNLEWDVYFSLQVSRKVSCRLGRVALRAFNVPKSINFEKLEGLRRHVHRPPACLVLKL